MATIEVMGMASRQGLHEATQRRRIDRRHDQIETVVAQAVGVNGHTALTSRLPQALHEPHPVFVVANHGLLMLGALAHQMRQTGDRETRQTGHGAWKRG